MTVHCHFLQDFYAAAVFLERFTRKRNIQSSYIFFLAISFFIVAGFWKLGYLELKEDSSAFSHQETTGISPFFEADRSYFDDALFIGDSRTVGLYEYGNLGNAMVLADSGMNVYKVFNRSFKLPSGESKTLEEILTEKQFGKIYVMLGINELGYDFDQTVKVYKDMIERIESLQPDAIIYLQANLHITGKKSEKTEIYNNDNINRFNHEVQQMTDSGTCFFLDANELFDDEKGNLSADYTVDEAHVLGKYYADWVDWILCHCVTQNSNLSVSP